MQILDSRLLKFLKQYSFKQLSVLRELDSEIYEESSFLGILICWKEPNFGILEAFSFAEIKDEELAELFAIYWLSFFFKLIENSFSEGIFFTLEENDPNDEDDGISGCCGWDLTGFGSG